MGWAIYLRMNQMIKVWCKSGAHVCIEDVKSSPRPPVGIEGTLSLSVVGATKGAATLWLWTSEGNDEPEDEEEWSNDEQDGLTGSRGVIGSDNDDPYYDQRTGTPIGKHDELRTFMDGNKLFGPKARAT